MSLENMRTFMQGVMILIFLAIAVWWSMTVGLWLILAMGLLILQSSFTNWCLVDPMLQLFGFKYRK